MRLVFESDSAIQLVLNSFETITMSLASTLIYIVSPLHIQVPIEETSVYMATFNFLVAPYSYTSAYTPYSGLAQHNLLLATAYETHGSLSQYVNIMQLDTSMSSVSALPIQVIFNIQSSLVNILVTLYVLGII